MLAGQVITLLNSLIIGLTGLFIVMIELGLLAMLVIGLSKSITKLNVVIGIYELGKKNLNKTEDTKSLEKREISEVCGVLDEEIAAIAVAICEESNLRPEEFIITSIIKK